MLKTIKTILIIYLLALFSVTILPRLSIYGFLPSLILIVSLVHVFNHNLKTGLINVTIGVLFLDFFGLFPPYNILIAVGLILLSWFLLTKFFEISNAYIFIGFCFLICFLYNLILFHNLSYLFVIHYFFDAVYSVICGLIIYKIFLRYNKPIYSLDLSE